MWLRGQVRNELRVSTSSLDWMEIFRKRCGRNLRAQRQHVRLRLPRRTLWSLGDVVQNAWMTSPTIRSCSSMGSRATVGGLRVRDAMGSAPNVGSMGARCTTSSVTSRCRTFSIAFSSTVSFSAAERRPVDNCRPRDPSAAMSSAVACCNASFHTPWKPRALWIRS